MATVSGNIIGNLSGKLGNLSARTIKGRTVMYSRPSSFNASQEPDVIEIRKKFAVTSKFSKYVLSLPSLAAVWDKVKPAGISAFNAIFKANFPYSFTQTPSNQNIISPEGFPITVESPEVTLNGVTADVVSLGANGALGREIGSLSFNVLLCFYNTTVPNAKAFHIIAFSQSSVPVDEYSLILEFNLMQQNIISRYADCTLYLNVVSNSPEGKVVKHSSTYYNSSAIGTTP